MSYDIRIVRKNDKQQVYFKNAHEINGGTYRVGGTDDAWLNITYNYYPIFKNLFGEDGIRSIYGRNIAEVQQILIDATKTLNDDIDDDYWKCTEGNVKIAISNLIKIADIAMAEFPEIEMIWTGD